MTRLNLRAILFGLLAMLGCGSSFATVITYETTQLGGSTWRYDYVVTNDTLGTPIEEFAIFFELGRYANLTALGLPGDWDGFVAQPDPLLPDDGFIDVLTFAGGVLTGDSLGAFSIVFDWLGDAAPGSQRFDIIDPLSFTTLDSGFTTRAATPPTSAPEPSVLVMLGLALLAFAVSRRRTARAESRDHA